MSDQDKDPPDTRMVAQTCAGLSQHSADIFRLLAGARGAVVSKKDLLAGGWPDQIVSEDSLYQSIAEIRRALGADRRDALVTVHGQGYALTGGLAASAYQEPVRYAKARDGTQIAWTVSGQGVPLVKAPNWISHIGLERNSKLYRSTYDRLERLARIVRFDQRGNGLSDWNVPDFTLDAMVGDIETVADAAGLERFFLYGISQGVAYSLAFAARFPDRVIGIIGRGGYAAGALASGDPEAVRDVESRVTIIRNGWASDDTSYRRFFTNKIMPDAPADLVAEFDDIQAQAVPTENALRFVNFAATLDIRALLSQVATPVLLVHSRGDRMIPVARGRDTAALLPNAEFIELDSRNHTLLPGSESFERSISAFEAFLRKHGDG